MTEVASDNMAAFRGGKLFTVAWGQVRHKSKINIQRPKPGPWDRRVLLEISRPILWEEVTPPAATCSKRKAIKESQEESDFEKFLVHHAKKMFEENEMIAIMHLPSITAQELRGIRNKFYKEGIWVFRHANSIVRKAIRDTKWANLTPVLLSHNYYAYASENKVAELMKVIKKSPQLNLLCAVVDNAILSKADMEKYASSSLDLQRSQLVALLSSGATRTHSLLNSHQQKLSTNLTQYIKQQTEGS